MNYFTFQKIYFRTYHFIVRRIILILVYNESFFNLCHNIGEPVVGRIMSPSHKNVSILIPRTCAQVTLHHKKDITQVGKVKDSEKRRWF